MSVKYGATDVHKKIEENDKEVPTKVEVHPSGIRQRRWALNQNYMYGLGHVLNDLCAAMWFSYTMLYFQSVIEMVPGVAGAMMLLGQVVDALATPVVGVLADRHGTKKAWHLVGCVIVMCTFPLIFVRCFGCQEQEYRVRQIWMPIYYGILIVFFQIGWAVVQISHLAMIPELSNDLKIRSNLTSIRYMASVASSLVVYIVTWLVLRSSYSTTIGPTDDYKFRDIALILTALGLLSVLIFHKFFKLQKIKEEKLGELHKGQVLQNNNHSVNETHIIKNEKSVNKGDHATMNGNGVKKGNHPVNGHTAKNGTVIDEEGKQIVKSSRSRIMYYLRMPLLYETSLLYVFSRLYWALSLVYVPLFLEERLSMNPTSGSQLVASVPLVVYVSSMIFSVLLRSKLLNCGNYMAYLIGSLISLISCLWIALAIDPQAHIWQIYLVAALIGAGSSITLVSSLCVTADLIGPNTHHGASIYSIVTFADKLVTGFAVVAIENYKCSTPADCPQYYRGVLTYACGGSAILGILSLFMAHRGLKHKTETHL